MGFLNLKGVTFSGAILVIYVGGIVIERLADTWEAWIVHLLLRKERIRWL